MAAWVSSIHGLNQKITPSTSGGHAQSQVQSSLAFSSSPKERLTRTEALVSFRVLNRIKPQNPVHVWNSANFFKFHSCGHTLQETRRLCFRLGHARALGRSLRAHTASQQSLWLGLLRSLIVIDTPTLVLGRRASPRWALSPPVVLAGSANSTSRQPVLPPSNFSLLYRGLRARPLSEESTLGAQIKARPPSGCTHTLLRAARSLSRLGTFNRSNNLVGSLPWYYRACWHQNLAQIAFARLCRTRSSLGQALGCPLTISARGHWIVFVPAASLGHESCLSGFLCGIGP